MIALIIAINAISQFITILNSMESSQDPLELLANISVFSTVGSLQLVYGIIAIVVVIIMLPLTITMLIMKK